jgi:hypothetical protein
MAVAVIFEELVTDLVKAGQEVVEATLHLVGRPDELLHFADEVEEGSLGLGGLGCGGLRRVVGAARHCGCVCIAVRRWVVAGGWGWGECVMSKSGERSLSHDEGRVGEICHCM